MHYYSSSRPTVKYTWDRPKSYDGNMSTVIRARFNYCGIDIVSRDPEEQRYEAWSPNAWHLVPYPSVRREISYSIGGDADGPRCYNGTRGCFDDGSVPQVLSDRQVYRAFITKRDTYSGEPPEWKVLDESTWEWSPSKQTCRLQRAFGRDLRTRAYEVSK